MSRGKKFEDLFILKCISLQVAVRIN